MKKTNQKNNRYTRIMLIFIFLLSVPTRTVEAADAYVYFKDKTTPLYISNFTISYIEKPRPLQQAIAALPFEMKYFSYGFDQIQKITFLRLVGTELSGPVFLIDLQLIRKGASREVVLMPIRELNGYHLGTPWVFPMDAYREFEENVEKIKEIRFVHKR